MSLVQNQLSSASRSVPFQTATRAPVSAKGGYIDATKDALDRRSIMILTSSLVTSYFQLGASVPAAVAETPVPTSAATSSNRGLARYIRKKQLDALETYVPLLLEAKQQLSTSGQLMSTDKETARSLLRTGAFGGLRDNVRAVGEYAVQSGKEKEASVLVNGFFNSLVDYDRVLNVAIRGNTELDMKDATDKLQATVKALDSLLDTVPSDIREKAQSMLASAKAKSESSQAANVPSEEDRVLRSLLN